MMGNLKDDRRDLLQQERYKTMTERGRRLGLLGLSVDDFLAVQRAYGDVRFYYVCNARRDTTVDEMFAKAYEKKNVTAFVFMVARLFDKDPTNTTFNATCARLGLGIGCGLGNTIWNMSCQEADPEFCHFVGIAHKADMHRCMGLIGLKPSDVYDEEAA